MVGVEAALEIRVLHRHGKSIREIARETGIARNTVRRYLRDEEAARYKPRPPRSTKLDPFKAYIAERLGSAAPEWIPASVLLMELRERLLWRLHDADACSGDCDRPFRPKVITDSGDRDHAVTRPIGSA